MKTSEFVRDAKKYLQHPNRNKYGTPYICLALDICAAERLHCDYNLHDANAYVRRKLDCYYTYQQWLKHRRPHLYYAAKLGGKLAQYVQFKRMSFMEEMAQYFERQGD